MPTMVPRRLDAAGAGLAVGFLLLLASMAVPAALDWNVHSNRFPPVHATWHPRVGWGTVPALLIAAAASRYASRAAAQLGWRRLLVVTFVASLMWMLALAFVDGSAGVGHILDRPGEYLRTARTVTDVRETLGMYVSRIGYEAAPDNWPAHVAGHPPGALLFFVTLVRVGLGGGFAAGLVVTVIAATTPAAVLVTLHTLGAAQLGRRAAPYLTFGPAAIWQAVSADAMFAAVCAWGLCALALASVRAAQRSPGTRHRRTRPHWLPWSLVAGLLLGVAVMLSYGLLILAIVALAVLWMGGSWRPMPVVAVSASCVVLTFAVLGYAYWEALPELHQRYWDGVARVRPATYWIWGDLAALLFSAGPLAAAGFCHLLARRRTIDTSSPLRLLVVLGTAGWMCVLVADLSQMSKAEVERIWLPFVPWLLLPCALLPDRWQRPGLALQLGFALLVQHLLSTSW